MLVIGKTIGGGIPVGTYGFTEEIGRPDLDERSRSRTSDVGGVGGTLAGYALSMSAVRATLTEVLTDAAFDRMIDARRALDGRGRGRHRLARRPVARHPARLPRRVPLHADRRRATAPSSSRPADFELERFLHLYAMNRRILMTPFHNMALMCPATTEADVDRHTEVFAAAVDELFG